jgi:site-specific recombinase XerD
MNSEHPLEPYIQPFLSELGQQKRLQFSSLELYQGEIKQLLALLPTPENLEGLKAHLSGKASATHRRKIVMWKQFLKTCPSPWDLALSKLVMPKHKQKMPHFLTEPQKAHLLRQVRNVDESVLLTLALSTGLRLSEILSLHFSDLESDFFRVIRKGGKEQRLPMTDELLSLLKEYRKQRGASPSDKVIPFKRTKVREMIWALGRRATLPFKLHPHALRHTFATQLASNNAPLHHLKELLGHESLATTEKYLHVKPSYLKETLKLLEGPNPENDSP